MKTQIVRFFVLLILICTTSPHASLASGIDGLGLNLGQSRDDKVNFYRIGITFDIDQKWLEEGDWYLGSYFDIGFIVFDSRSAIVNTTGAPSHLLAAAITPVFRLQRIPYANRVAPFFDAAIGASYFSNTTLQGSEPSGIDFGGHFQFEIILSGGLYFGDQQQYETHLSYFHYSNFEFGDSNDGINITSLSMSIRF